jgi:hypothetical protein
LDAVSFSQHVAPPQLLSKIVLAILIYENNGGGFLDISGLRAGLAETKNVASLYNLQRWLESGRQIIVSPCWRLSGTNTFHDSDFLRRLPIDSCSRPFQRS